MTTDGARPDGVSSAVTTALASLVDRVGEDAHLLIAWSGGADSTALLHAAARRAHRAHPDLEVHAGHIDHGYRPDSAYDAQWCHRWAQRLSVPLHIETLGMQDDTNLEARARTRRYAALRIMARGIDADAVWTGHHRDDVLETAILHWMRGAGSDGLTSLVPGSPDRHPHRGAPAARPTPTPAWRDAAPELQRPLASVRADATRNYLARVDVDWCLDDTNRDRHHRRNRIRQDVMPALRAESTTTDSMFRTLENLRDEADFIADRVDEFIESNAERTLNDESVACRTDALAQAHPAVAARTMMALARALPSPVGWDRATLQRIRRSAADIEPGDVDRFALRGAAVTVGTQRVTFALERQRGTESLDARRTEPIQLETRQIADGTHRVPWFDGYLHFDQKPRDALPSPPPPTHCAWFDADSLADILIVTGPPDSSSTDRFSTQMKPINFDGHKQLADLLREADVPPEDRWRHPCLYAGPSSETRADSSPQPLLWVPAARQASNTKVTDETRQIVVARLVKQSADQPTVR
jgi:tRNA(Ile)-lysidine synthetase-like protein